MTETAVTAPSFPAETRSPAVARSKEQRAVLVVVRATYMMILLDTSIVITGLPEIRDGLGFSAVGLAWVQNAYTLAFGGFMPARARAGDIFGRRRVYLAGLAPTTLSLLTLHFAEGETRNRALGGTLGLAVLITVFAAAMRGIPATDAALAQGIRAGLHGAAALAGFGLILILSLSLILPAERRRP